VTDSIDSVAAGTAGGRIAMVPCPGTRGGYGGPPDALDHDLAAIAAWGAQVLVTLNEHGELETLGLQMLPVEVRRHGMQHLHLPVRDMDTPSRAFERAWRRHGPDLRHRLRAGERIALHCWAGLGRTGTLSARLLVELGEAPDAAILAVRSARRGTIQTFEQELHVRSCRPCHD